MYDQFHPCLTGRPGAICLDNLTTGGRSELRRHSALSPDADASAATFAARRTHRVRAQPLRPLQGEPADIRQASRSWCRRTALSPRGAAPSAPGQRQRLAVRVIGSIDDMMALGDETWLKLISQETVPVPRTSRRRCGCRRLQEPRIVASVTRRRSLPARHGVGADADRARALRRGSLQDVADRRIERSQICESRRSSRWPTGPAPRQVAELLSRRARPAGLRAHVLRDQRRAVEHASPIRRGGAIRIASCSRARAAELTSCRTDRLRRGRHVHGLRAAVARQASCSQARQCTIWRAAGRATAARSP